MKILLVLAPVIIMAALGIMFELLERIDEENKALEAGLEASRMYSESIRSKMEKIRRFRHDAVGLLQAIDAYGLDADGTLPAQGLAGSGRYAYAAVIPMPMLEAVISLKRDQCREAGITFSCPDSFPEDWRLLELPEENDLCLLIQNLLDNAYEASLRISDESQRWMSLECEGIHGTGSDEFTVRVANRIDKNEKVSFLTRKNDAKLHGIGLRIVDDIIRKYDGVMSVRTDADRHIITFAVRFRVKNGQDAG